MDSILCGPLAKTQPKWCQAESSLGSGKCRLFSATEIVIPLSQTGSLPSSTEALSLFSCLLGTSFYQKSQCTLLVSCSSVGDLLQRYTRVCKPHRGKPEVIPVPPKLDSEDKSGEIEITES